MTLFTPNYDVRTRAFCGPTAISCVTGERISVIRRAIRDVRGTMSKNGREMPVMGLSNDDLLAAMTLLGWKVESQFEDAPKGSISRRDRFLFGEFLDHYGEFGPYIVNVTGHYYAVSHGEVCDTFTKLPKDIEKFHKGRKRWVQRWWKFAKA